MLCELHLTKRRAQLAAILLRLCHLPSSPNPTIMFGFFFAALTIMNINPFRTSLIPGLLLTGALAALAMFLATMPWAKSAGLSVLPLAIVIGMLLGNTVFRMVEKPTGAGVDYAKGILLRAGIILYGFRITFQQIADVGLVGVLMAAIVVGFIFLLGTWLGRKVFKLEPELAMLIGSGAGICGAAAVLATQPVVRGKPEHVSIAVATVVVFGTISMFLYPFLYPVAGFSEHQFGLYIGASVHEVAQVVAAGRAVGDVAAASAVIEKMLRVMMLAPFLIVLSLWIKRSRQSASGEKMPLVIPWFAVAFIAVAGFNSLHLLPANVVDGLIWLDTLLLAMAMTALGLRTQWTALKQAGIKPLLLALVLFFVLIALGYGLVFLLT